MLYNLHIHSCLSPCADDDMTPANIAGISKLAGADLIAITDHNSALNLPAAKKTCDEYGLKLLPGIEVTTEEEIHVLCYFKDIETAMKFSDMLYDLLIESPYDEDIWGAQIVMDENDNIQYKVKKLLSGPTNLNIYDLKAECEKHGGIAIPAHVEKDSTSILSVLGFLPDDLTFDVVESKDVQKFNAFVEKGFFPKPKEILTSSDAHFLTALEYDFKTLSDDSVLFKLID